MANHIANLGTDMLTNPTVVHLHERCMDSTPTHITNLGTDMLTNPTSCSIVPKMHGFYGDSHCKPWRRHAYKPYQLFNCTKDAWILQQYCKPWHRHAYKPYSCSIVHNNAWILWQFPWQTLAQILQLFYYM